MEKPDKRDEEIRAHRKAEAERYANMTELQARAVSNEEWWNWISHYRERMANEEVAEIQRKQALRLPRNSNAGNGRKWGTHDD